MEKEVTDREALEQRFTEYAQIHGLVGQLDILMERVMPFIESETATAYAKGYRQGLRDFPRKWSENASEFNHSIEYSEGDAKESEQ